MAVSGMMVALGAAVMLLGWVIPLATFCCPALAGFALIPLVFDCGRTLAWCGWAAIALLGLMLDGITEKLKKVILSERALTELLNALKNVRMELSMSNADATMAVRKQIDNLEKKIQTGKLSSTLSADAEFSCRTAMATLEDMIAVLKEKAPADGTSAFKLIKAEFDSRTKALKKHADSVGKQLSNVFTFCEDVFNEGQEILILVTELTISYYGANFISRYGCKEYFNHNKELLFHERQKEIIREIENLELEV
jgi:hypothetical protein